MKLFAGTMTKPRVGEEAAAEEKGLFLRVHSFVVVVRDDGNGIPAGPCAPHGVGLDGMVSRARAFGAQLEVRGIPGRGTTVRCVVPF